MWGNKNGILDDLFAFARSNSNVILELKTKSHNITYLLQNDIPKNVIVTWSLNPQSVIDHEENFSASLDKRIHSAKMVADKGALVGFHFHPMIYFDGWEQEYSDIANSLVEKFQPSQVALVSLGTVTFTKKVINQIRSRGMKTKILQMDLVDAGGKLSYPLEIKEELFSHLYQSLKKWHDNVFFYMCMEDMTLWKTVFGYEYQTNDELEVAMIDAYWGKVTGLCKDLPE